MVAAGDCPFWFIGLLEAEGFADFLTRLTRLDSR